MKVLVTGATGFVGINLIRSLTNTEHDPVVFARDTNGMNGIPEEISAVEGDITQQGDVERALEKHGCDGIVHLAAIHGRYGAAETQGGIDWDLMREVNVNGSRSVFEAAEDYGVETVVFAGTLKSHPYFEGASDADYIKSKREAQSLLQNNEYEFDWTVVNPSTVVGPHDFRLAHFAMYQLICSNLILAPPMYIPKKINFVHARDVADSIIHYLENPTGACELVTGENTTMRRYCRLISGAKKGNCMIMPLPFAGLYLPFVLDMANRFGLVPVSSSQFNWSDRSVPQEIAECGPIEHKSTKEIVEDTHAWYSDAELL